MRAVAAQYAANGIRSNAVVPGFTDTPLVADLTPDERAAIEATIPMRRAGTPSEVAAVIAFLASDDASYVTGAIYTVDGGATAI